jgi:hypothetical protein
LRRDLERIERQLSDLAKHLAEKEGKAAERELGTRKGVDFEAMLLSTFDQLSRPFRDVVTDISTIAADDGSKRGDLLVQLNKESADGHDAYIVVEAKRRSKTIGGRRGILEEMNEAMASRQAQFAIAVFSDDVCPDEVGRFRAYPNNRIICSVDRGGKDLLALEIAYQLARTELCWQLRHDARGVDQAMVANAVRHAEEKLNQFQGLKQNAANLISTANKIRDRLDDIEREIRSALKDVLDELEREG